MTNPGPQLSWRSHQQFRLDCDGVRESSRASPQLRTGTKLLRFLVIAAVAFVSSTAWAQSRPAVELLRGQFEHELKRLADGFGGVLGVETIDLTDGARVGINADVAFAQASAIKVPILIELFRRGEETPQLLRMRRKVSPENRTEGSGVLLYLTDRSSDVSLEDLGVLMTVLSDNTATNILIDELGMERINQTMASLGFSETRLRRKMMRLDLAAKGEENVSTPAEAARLMQRLARCELPLSADSCSRVRTILELPKDDPVREPVPDTIKMAFKPGYTGSVRTAWALVDLPGRPYALAVMTSFDLEGIGGDGASMVRSVSKATYEYYQRLVGANKFGVRAPVK